MFLTSCCGSFHEFCARARIPPSLPKRTVGVAHPRVLGETRAVGPTGPGRLRPRRQALVGHEVCAARVGHVIGAPEDRGAFVDFVEHRLVDHRRARAPGGHVLRPEERASSSGDLTAAAQRRLLRISGVRRRTRLLSVWPGGDHGHRGRSDAQGRSTESPGRAAPSFDGGIERPDLHSNGEQPVLHRALRAAF